MQMTWIPQYGNSSCFKIVSKQKAWEDQVPIVPYVFCKKKLPNPQPAPHPPKENSQKLRIRKELQPDSISYFCNMRAERWWETLQLFNQMSTYRRSYGIFLVGFVVLDGWWFFWFRKLLEWQCCLFVHEIEGNLLNATPTQEIRAL